MRSRGAGARSKPRSRAPVSCDLLDLDSPGPSLFGSFLFFGHCSYLGDEFVSTHLPFPRVGVLHWDGVLRVCSAVLCFRSLFVSRRRVRFYTFCCFAGRRSMCRRTSRAPSLHRGRSGRDYWERATTHNGRWHLLRAATGRRTCSMGARRRANVRTGRRRRSAPTASRARR